MSDITTKSMVASFSSGLPRQSTKLVEEAEQIETKNNAEAGTVKASMHYFRMRDPEKKKKSDINGLQLLKDYIDEYKDAFHREAKYPYKGELYLLPGANVDALLTVKEKFEGQKRLDVWQKWADTEYSKWLDSAPSRMGHLYAKADFPSLSDCMQRFKAEVTILPLGDKEQIARIALIAPKTQQFLSAHADETSKKAVAELHKQIWADLMKPLQHVVTVFEKDKPKVFETLLGDLMEIVSVIPSYNHLLGDPELAAAAEQVKKTLGQLTTEDLRTSDEARKVALTTAKDMVNKLTPFARKFS